MAQDRSPTASRTPLEMGEEFDNRLRRLLLQRAELAITASKERDEIFTQYMRQLDGIGEPLVSGPWKNSCQLDDPLTDEWHTTQLSTQMTAIGVEPLCLVEAVVPGEAARLEAQQIEQGLTVKSREWGLLRSLYSVIYCANLFPYALAKVGWQNGLRRRRVTARIDAISGAVLEGEMETPADVEVSSQTVVEDIDGIVVRVPDPRNVYFYPVDATDVESAELVIEKLWLTPDELMEAGRLGSYDPDMVEALLKLGPTWVSGERSEESADEGLDLGGMEGYYEVLEIIGRMPHVIEDGKSLTPPHLLDEEFVWVLSPEHDMRLYWGSLEEPSRPWVAVHTHRKPWRMQGKSVVSRLEALQKEATGCLRYMMDVANLDACPVILRPKKSQARQKPFRAFPGAEYLYETSPAEIQAMVWDKAGPQLLMANLADLRATAQRLISVEGANTNLGGIQRQDAEMAFAGAGMSSKNTLYLSVLSEGLEKLYAKVLEVWAQHLGADGEEIAAGGEASITISPAMLRSRFRLVPHINTSGASAQERRAMTEAKVQAQGIWLQALTGGLPPQLAPLVYHASRRMLEELGERDVEAWLGPEPQVLPPMGSAMPEAGGNGAVAPGMDPEQARVMEQVGGGIGEMLAMQGMQGMVNAGGPAGIGGA